jgi:enoyl-CoA hydratase/carnithine racemase
MRFSAATAAVPPLLLAALAAGAIAAAETHPGDRHRRVQGWLVEDMAESDGGRLVRMTRTSGPFRLEYHAAFWRGNDGTIQHLSATGRGCGGSEALDRDLVYHVSEIRARLAAALAGCAAPPGAVRAALRGLEPAYALALAWDWDARAATAAEAAAIADYGMESCDAPLDNAAEQDVSETNATGASAC